MVNESHPPFTLGQSSIRMGLAGGTTTKIGPVLDPNLDGEVPRGHDSASSISYDFAVSLLPEVDLSLEGALSVVPGVVGAVGLKYQFLGYSAQDSRKGNHMMALKFQYLGSRDLKDEENDRGGRIYDEIRVDEMSLSGFAVSLSYGHQFHDLWGAYMGGKYLNARYDFDYTDSNGLNPRSEERKVEGGGGFMGVFFAPYRLSSKKVVNYLVTLELAGLYLQKTFEDEKAWFFSAQNMHSIQLNW